MRLDKFISHCTTLSRKQSRAAIKSKRVSVDGAIVTDFGLLLQNNPNVVLNGETLELPQARYYMLNKPLGVVCANTDPNLPCAIDLIDDERPSLNIAGRLDKDTSGLVLLSDDGDWIHNIISPNRACYKTYIAGLDSAPTEETIKAFADGIQLRGEEKLTRPALVENIGDLQVKISIEEGRYHQVRRMFAACGHHVETLHRQQIGDIVLDENLTSGQSRPLTTTEINSVKPHVTV